MSTIAAAPAGTKGSPARVVTALAASVALTAVMMTFSAGRMTGTSLACTPQPRPTSGTAAAEPWCTPSGALFTVPRSTTPAHLPSPRPLPSASRR